MDDFYREIKDNESRKATQEADLDDEEQEEEYADKTRE